MFWNYLDNLYSRIISGIRCFPGWSYNIKYRIQTSGPWKYSTLQDIFLSLFFISIGMLLNVNFVLENLPLIILLTITVILLKSVIAGIVAGILGLSFRVMVLVGLMLSQIGGVLFYPGSSWSAI